MARIAGVNIPPQKRVEIGLTYIYGIGRSTSNKVLALVGIDPNTKVRDLTGFLELATDSRFLDVFASRLGFAGD